MKHKNRNLSIRVNEQQLLLSAHCCLKVKWTVNLDSHHSRVRFRASSQDLLQIKCIYSELRLEKTNEGNLFNIRVPQLANNIVINL